VIFETKRLTNQTRRSADIAQKNLVLSRRPWLDIIGDIKKFNLSLLLKTDMLKLLSRPQRKIPESLQHLVHF
jgi:hypothetical protein